MHDYGDTVHKFHFEITRYYSGGKKYHQFDSPF